MSPIPHCVSPVDTTPINGSISEDQVFKTSTDNDSSEFFSPVSNGKGPPNTISAVQLSSSGKHNKVRARLLNRFETAESQESGEEVHGESDSRERVCGVAGSNKPIKSPDKPACAVSTVQPAPTAVGGWSDLPKMCV